MIIRARKTFKNCTTLILEEHTNQKKTQGDLVRTEEALNSIWVIVSSAAIAIWARRLPNTLSDELQAIYRVRQTSLWRLKQLKFEPAGLDMRWITCWESCKLRSHQTLSCHILYCNRNPSHGMRWAANYGMRKPQIVIASSVVMSSAAWDLRTELRSALKMKWFQS